MESLVLKFCEELAMEFVDAKVKLKVFSCLGCGETKVKELGYGEPKSYIAWAVGNLRLILPGPRGLRGN
jgi:hypothetical protein